MWGVGLHVRVFPDVDALAHSAASAFADLARACVEERGAFHVALSGGSTPKFLYRALRQPSAGQSGELALPWSAVHVYFSDERAVPPDSPESNYKLARDGLLAHVPIPEAQVFRIKGELEPHEAAREAEGLLPPRLDLVLLGMGDDGHTASLFPGTAGLDATNRVAANFVPKLDSWRLTFTVGEINAARERWLLVTGSGKAGVLREVQDGVGEYPVARVKAPVWWLDEEAAAQLR